MRLGLINTLLSPQLDQSVGDIRERISVTATEAVTGRYLDLTTHLDGRIGDAMLTQRALDDITNEQSRLDLSLARLEITQQSLGIIQDANANGISTRLLGSIATENFDQIEASGREAKTALEVVFTAMNARLQQRQLFSGDATSSGPLQPVDELLSDVQGLLDIATDAADFQASIDTYFDDPAGGWQTSIYNGTPTASDSNAVLAIDPAITELVKGLATLALADGNIDNAVLTETSDVLTASAQAISTGTERVIDLRVAVGRNEETIAVRKETLSAETAILAETFNALTGRDQYEAATELRQLESSLEASYLLTSRLSNLSLLNYIR